MKLRLFGVLLLTAVLAFVTGCGDDNNSLGGEPVPTNTAPPPTNTAAAPTATPVVPPTATPAPPTATQPSGPTATPTGTPEPGGLGTRAFTISTMVTFGGTAQAARSGLFSSALTGGQVSTGFDAEQPMMLVGGTPDADGVASLALAQDEIIAVTQPLGVVCFKLIAAGSSGSIDCDGGTAYDITLTEDPGAGVTPATPMTGQGNPAGAGNADLILMQQSVQLASSATLADCEAATYDPPVMTAYTTTMITATKGAASITGTGEAFDCANFAQTDGPGMLLNPSVANQAEAGGDVANYLRLSDTDPAPAP